MARNIRMTDDEKLDMVLAEAKVQFPDTFGLRAFPGDVFRISPIRFKHFVSEGQVQIVVEVKRGEKWLDMGRNTLVNIVSEATKLG